MNGTPIPMWAEIVVGLLLVTSGVFTLLAAFGMLRFRTFFMRMHPTALAYTMGAWCVAFASIVFFSVTEGELELRAWLILILLAMTVPVTTVLLARVVLFRDRQAGRRAPPPLSYTIVPGDFEEPHEPPKRGS